MKKKILVATVGGSCAPIVTSIRENNPDFVHFICSDDYQGRPGSYKSVDGECISNNIAQPNIVQQTNLKKKNFKIHKLKNPDNFDHCFRCIQAIFEGLFVDPGISVYADYTGGTKSMSSALVCSSLGFSDVKLYVVIGDRIDLDQVVDGSQYGSLVSTSSAVYDQQMKLVQNLVHLYDYAGALTIVESLQHITDQQELEKQRYAKLLRAFDFWDRFEHYEAYRILNADAKFKEGYPNHIDYLKRVICSRCTLEVADYPVSNLSKIDCTDSTGYEVIYDLLLNAERREYQMRYDDAVGRLYRLTELTAQLLLKKKHGLETGNLKVGQLPLELQSLYDNGVTNEPVQLDLAKSYSLLEKLSDSTLKEHIAKKMSSIKGVIGARNSSILAHGFTPVLKNDYRNIYNVIVGFVEKILDLVNAKIEYTDFQLPRDFLK